MSHSKPQNGSTHRAGDESSEPIARSRLHATGFSVRRGDRPLISGLNLDLPGGHCLGVIGPNGAGKSSLLLALRGQLFSEGGLSLGERDPRRCRADEVARTVAVVPQRNEFAFSMRVDEMILLGRAPYRKPWQGWGEEDRRVAWHWMERLGLQELASRSVDQLSGGERRRVFIARALVQETPFLFLDEPLAGLDPAAAEEIVELLTSLRQRQERTQVLVLHDVSRVGRLCDQVLGLGRGGIEFTGVPGGDLQPDMLENLFRIPWLEATSPGGQRSLIPREREQR